MRIRNLFFLVLVVIFASCSAPLYNSVWQAKSVNADGNAKEWPIPLSYFDGDSKIQYTFSNDKENIYVCMKVADSKSQLKMEKAHE